MTLHLANEQATIELAGALADALPEDIATWTILLEGDLGPGIAQAAR